MTDLQGHRLILGERGLKVNSSCALDSPSVVRLALTMSEGVEWIEGEEICSTLGFPSAKTTHFAAMFSIGNSEVDEFLPEGA